MKNIVINGKTFNDVSRIAINTTDGTAYFKDEDEASGGAEVATGVLDLQGKDWTSGTFSFAHGCSKAPDVVVISSNYDEVFADGVVPSGTTNIGMMCSSITGLVCAKTMAVALTTNQTTMAFPNTGDGQINSIDTESVTVKLASSKRFDKRLTYTFKCIVL